MDGSITLYAFKPQNPFAPRRTDAHPLRKARDAAHQTRERLKQGYGPCMA